jgi:hypothetical protein
VHGGVRRNLSGKGEFRPQQHKVTGVKLFTSRSSDGSWLVNKSAVRSKAARFSLQMVKFNLVRVFIHCSQVVHKKQ